MNTTTTTAETITYTPDGDDRARTYAVTWRGTADVSDSARGHQGRAPLALVQRGPGDSERLAYEHPKHGWISVGDAGVRDVECDGEPPTDARLRAAW